MRYKGSMVTRTRLAVCMGLCLAAVAARCDRTPAGDLAEEPARPPPIVTELPANAPILDDLGDADKASSPRRVRLIGMTSPDKDAPYLALKRAKIELEGKFDRALWERRDRLVVLDGSLTWTPIRAVPTVDENGMPFQSRGQVGGWSLRAITGVHRPTLADLVGRMAWIEGMAVLENGRPAVRGEGTPTLVDSLPAWPEDWQGREVRVEGRIGRRGSGFVITDETAWYPIDLGVRVVSDVDLAGRCWRNNDDWFFSWHGEKIAIEDVPGSWPPRHVTEGGHGALVRVKGRLSRSDRGRPEAYVIRPRITLTLRYDELFDATW